MKQPSASTFWRFVLAVLALFAFLAYWDLIQVTQELNIVVAQSKPWLSLFVLLSAFILSTLFLVAMSYSQRGPRLIQFLDSAATKLPFQKLLSVLLLFVGLSGFALFTSNAYFIRVLGNASGVRYLLFVLFSLLGMWGIKVLRNDLAWMTALLITVLCQSLIHLLLVNFSQVTAYPFAMGWSETSRLYFT
jgi:hypothetical protein